MLDAGRQLADAEVLEADDIRLREWPDVQRKDEERGSISCASEASIFRRIRALWTVAAACMVGFPSE
jgi:hypothetical protein